MTNIEIVEKWFIENFHGKISSTAAWNVCLAAKQDLVERFKGIEAVVVTEEQEIIGKTTIKMSDVKSDEEE